jgi:hypothetical protein
MIADFISDDYYDINTYQLLFDALTEDDHDYINNTKEDVNLLLFQRWRTIINSFPSNYYNQYHSKNTPQYRNDWFKKYLDYPSKDISNMPEVL